MVFMRKELIASLSDLEAVIVECSNPACKAQVKVPVNLESHDLRLVGLIECPVCRGNFDSMLRDYVRAFIASLSAHHGGEKISLLLSSEGLEK